MQTERVRTGVRMKATFDQNLEAIKGSISSYGYEKVWGRLEEMKKFYWVNHSRFFESCECLICNLQKQVEYDQVLKRSAERDLTQEERITKLLAKYDKPNIGIVGK